MSLSHRRHHEESLDCPKCGAPTQLPLDLEILTLTCQYCDETFPIPRSLREAQERRFFGLQRTGDTKSVTTAAGAIVIAVTAAGVLLSWWLIYNANHKSAAVTPLEPPTRKLSTPSAPAMPPTPAIDTPVDDGESRVNELLARYEAAGCKTVLLPPTRIVGGRAIDAKLVSSGPCMRLVAATGTTHDALELTMRTPAGKSVDTPKASSELDFLYCAKRAGLYPTEIRSTSDQPFTVSSIECPRH